MAGHSHWAGIKHKKELTDKKRGRIFSKLLSAITAAAKTEANPEFNPRLRTAIEKARASKVPAENIERATKRASEVVGGLEELVFEAYGPSGAALIIDAITDNRNRTVAEVKKIMSDHEARWAERGSVRWAFEATPSGAWKAKFPQKISEEDNKKLAVLIESLLDHNDTQRVVTNVVGMELTEE